MIKKLFVLPLLLALAQLSSAQVSPENIGSISIPKETNQPIILLYHSMGDVNVKGHNSDKLFVYAQEFLPSITALVNQNKQEIFTHIHENYSLSKSKKNVPQFKIQQRDSVYVIETSVFSYNSNVFLLVPKRASVGVTVKDMGNIAIENLGGNVEANTKTGNIYIKDADGIVSASTVHGNVIGDFSNKARKQPLFISTFVGNIEIIIPKTSNNSILASSEMGKFYSNFKESDEISMMASSNPIKNRKLNFEINKGGTEFVINTFKGDIYLRYLSK